MQTQNNNIASDELLPRDLVGSQRRSVPHMVDCEKYATLGNLSQNNKSNTCKRKKEDKYKNTINMATWNVRGLNADGKVENILKEMKMMNIDIMGIGETFMKNTDDFFKSLPSNERFRLILSGGDKSRRGVGFILNQRCSELVTSVIMISDRVMAIRLNSSPVDLFIVQCYAPTADKSDEIIDAFYDQIREAVKHKKAREALFILGDFNAKVGNRRHGNIVGPFGLGNKNESGDHLINLCEEFQLCITNTWFEQKESARHTWSSPGDLVKNQIDFICVDQAFRNGVINSKSRPGADCGSDHNPVVARIKIKLKSLRKKTTSKKWNLERIKIPSTKQNFAKIFSEEVQ
ncbi:hypothetical protein M8J77_002882 [Diaphorina citri]|nr:hypothetical protein M8J77_002882 [Diaphorina citri]